MIWICSRSPAPKIGWIRHGSLFLECSFFIEFQWLQSPAPRVDALSLSFSVCLTRTHCRYVPSFSFYRRGTSLSVTPQCALLLSPSVRLSASQSVRLSISLTRSMSVSLARGTVPLESISLVGHGLLRPRATGRPEGRPELVMRPFRVV